MNSLKITPRVVLLASTAFVGMATPAMAQQSGPPTDTTAPAVQSQVPATGPATPPAQNSPATAAPATPPAAEPAAEASPPSTATPAAAPADDSGIADIVVTAERRASSVQRTAAAITAVSGQDLAARGVTDVTAITSLAPSVHINNYATGVQIGIRGVYSQSPSPSSDPAIAFNIDGVYQARPANAAGVFYDINRIEVLRGPQGTLYGRNATGGSVNIITNRPTHDTNASIQLGVGNYGLFQTTGVINTPVADNLFLRVSGNYIRHSGYTENSPAEDGNDENSVAGRVQLLWKPSATLDVRLAADYNHKGGVGPAGRLPTDREEDFSFPLNTASDTSNTTYGFTGEVNLDLGPATLTYIGAYRHLSYNYVYDNDYSAARSQVTTIGEKEYEVTNELRLSSSAGSGPLQYVVGVYQFYEHAPYFQTQVNTPSNGHTLYLEAPVINAKAYAAYGQATYSITPTLRVTGGARFTYDKKTQEAQYILDQTSIANNTGEKSWTAFNYKAGLEFDVTPRNMIYANVSTAYKAGGINQSIPATTYGPEHLKAFVLGTKNRFFDNKVQLNVEGFYYDYRDYQGALSLSTPNPAGAIVFNAIANAGKARVYGAEVEATVRITRHDQIDGSFSALETRFLDYVIGTTNFTGHLLAKAPPISFTAGYQHVFPVADGARVTARGEFHYEDDQFMSPTNAATSYSPHFHESNAFLRYDSADDKWFVNAYIRNIENGVHLTHVSLGAFINTPRTVGLLGGIKF